jgi:putative ABC transport system substrate-binding protein
MKRREFIALLGGATLVAPHAARAQQRPVVGLISSSTNFSNARIAGFHAGLKEAGFVHGENITVDYQTANDDPDRLQALLHGFIRRPVAVIAANSIAARAARQITTTTPIVFTTGSDPIKDGIVASLNRPGGNITGATFMTGRLGAKRLDLLRRLVPNAATIAALMYPGIPETEAEHSDLKAAAQAFGQQLLILEIRSAGDFEPAFATLSQHKAGAVVVGAGAFLFANRDRIIALAARHGIPTMYSGPEAVAAGGLMSYSAGIADAFRQAGNYAGRILKGEKPAELPVTQSTKFELALNLKTARTLGLEIPATLLALADEVIE